MSRWVLYPLKKQADAQAKQKEKLKASYEQKALRSAEQ
jgi:hypothetical protein